MKTNISTFSHQEGETLGVAGGNYRIILSGDQTNHAYAVIEMLVPPGGTTTSFPSRYARNVLSDGGRTGI